MSSALTFFLAAALSRRVSASVHGRGHFAFAFSPRSIGVTRPTCAFSTTSLAPLSSAAFEHSLKLGIAQEFVGHIEFSVELPFGAWQWLWQTPFFENVYYAVSSTASGHPLHVPP